MSQPSLFQDSNKAVESSLVVRAIVPLGHFNIWQCFQYPLALCIPDRKTSLSVQNWFELFELK